MNLILLRDLDPIVYQRIYQLHMKCVENEVDLLVAMDNVYLSVKLKLLKIIKN